MLEVDHLSYRYPAHMRVSRDVTGGATALDGVSWTLREGEKVAVLGANGSGKSTLLRCACALLRPQEGRIVLDGAPIRYDAAGLSVLRRAVGLVGQDPDDQMVASTVFEEVAFGPCNLGLDRDEVLVRVHEALRVCGLEGLEHRDVASLSGGQRQRVAVAGCLAMRPRYLLCDEPCSMLDSHARTEVLDALEAARAQGCGVALVTHEVADVLDCDRVDVVEYGKVLWQGSPAELLRNKMVRSRAACLGDAWTDVLGKLLAGGLISDDAPFTDPAACAKRVAQGGASACSAAWDTARGARPARMHRENAANDSAGRMLSGSDLAFSYDEPVRFQRRARGVTGRDGSAESEVAWAVCGVSLALRPGESLVVAGRTGSGKSTTALLLAGLATPLRGRVELDGRTPVPGEIGFAFQRAEDQLFAETVLADVMLGPRNRGLDASQARVVARKALERAGLDPDCFGDASPFDLSGGEARRAVVAGVLAMETPYVVLDEPTVGLDARGMDALRDLVADLTKRGVGVALVTHDVERVGAYADRAVVLEAGRIVWQGDACEASCHLAAGRPKGRRAVEMFCGLLDAAGKGGR